MLSKFIFFLVFITVCHAFAPQPIIQERGSRTHKDITTEGILRAVSKILIANNMVNSSHTDPIVIVRDYFALDTDGYQSFLDAISEIIQHNNNIQKDNANIAFFHVNAEQIDAAHVYLQRTSNLIAGMAKNSVHPPIHFIRQKIGEYLYTLQAFYSNTNWVEIYNLQVYKDFGTNTKTLLPIAAPEEDTCDNCNTDETNLFGSCDDNLILKKTLTSGYKSEQDIQKPAKPLDYQSGKCSHGGMDDKTSKIPATGGINKERFNSNYSPHFKLHPVASEAAVMATEHFITRNATGLLAILGLQLFQQVFNLDSHAEVSETSLAFCIDTTGSMSDDIKAVIQISTDLVTELQGSNNAPADYILTTFNDPAQVTRFNTSDGYKMITKLKGLRVHGGGDCPEYSLSGTLAAIELSRPGSSVYIFTDADAKDGSLQSEVERLARGKSISLTFFTTGKCGRKRDARNNNQNDIQNTHRYEGSRRRVVISRKSIYDQLANKTGGKTFSTTKHNLSSVISKVIEDKLPTAQVIIDYFKMGIGQKNVSISVDTTISTLRVEITGCSDSGYVTMQRPDGTNAAYTGKIKWLQRNNVGIISIQDPDKGEWQLIRKSNLNIWSVNVTAQSPLTFKSDIMDIGKDLMMYGLNGNPIAGINYKVFTTVYNLQNGSITDIRLSDKNGSTITTLDVQALDSMETIPGLQYISDIIFNTTVNGITLDGLDTAGYQFQRKRMFSVTPVTVALNIPSINDVKTLGVPFNVTFDVTNKGDSNQTFSARSTVKYGRLLGSKTKNIFVKSDTTVSGWFQLTSTTTQMPLELTIDLLLINSSEVLQRRTRQITITKSEHPKCLTSDTSQQCPLDSLNTANCSSYPWFAVATVSFSGVNITDIKMSSLAKMEVTDQSTSPLNISISGDCCVPSVVLTIFDNEQYTGTCAFEMSGGLSVQSVASRSYINPTKTKGKSKIGLITGTVSGNVVVIVIIFIIVFKRRRSRSTRA